MDLMFGRNKNQRGRVKPSPGERLKSSGFRRKKEGDSGACLFCDYDKLDEENVRRCCRLRVTFWDDFSAGEYVCNRYNGSEFDSIIEDLKDLE